MPRKRKTTTTASRPESRRLTELPNVGPATAADLERMGVRTPEDLVGRDPIALYRRLVALEGHPVDPCVADVFIAAVRYVERGDARPWWAHTARRKRLLATSSGVR